MSDQVYPELPGMTPVIRRRPEWKTRITEAWNGQETVVSQRAWPRWRYSLSYEVLQSEGGDLETLLGFYSAHRGQGVDFLFRDPDYHSVTGQVFGIGDGTAMAFQLVRAFAAWTEPVWAPQVAGLTIAQNGLPLNPAGYVIGTRGAVQFTTPPPAGALLAWSGSYHMRVRFDADDQEFERFLMGFSRVGSIDLYSKVFA